MGLSIKEYYSRGEYVAEGQLKLREKYGYDTLWGFHYVARQAELLGSRKTIYVDNGPPNVGHLIISDYDDIEKLQVPDNLSELPSFQELVKTIEILKREQGGKYPILSAVTASFSLPAILMGIDQWLNLLLTGPATVRNELLEKCSDFCRKLIRALRDAGVDMISYANPVATATFITAKQFRELALEWVKKDINEVGSQGIVYFNGGGKLNPMIDTIIENTDIGAYQISPQDDLSEAKNIIKGRALLSASINDIKLVSWSTEEIDQEVKRIMDAGAPGGGFIFGTLLMPYLIPEENIRTMLDAAYKYGKYSNGK
jgi:uroporphyrinogen decarboxylase